MGQRCLLQASVFRASVFFAILVSIPHGHSDCSVCQYKTTPTTSEITMFVGDALCSVPNATFVNNSNSITVTGLQPGNTYFLKIICQDVCCGNFSTITHNLNISCVTDSINSTITQLNSTSVYVNWTGQFPTANQSFTMRPEPVTNLSVSAINVSSMKLSWIPPIGISSYYKVVWGVNVVSITNQTFMQISQLAPGTKYTFTVTSVASDNHTEGHPAEISQNTSPAQVENITVLNCSNSSLTLGWPFPPGYVDSYEVNIPGLVFSTQNASNNFSVISNNLTAGRLYSVTVTTISGVLRSNSNPMQVATKPNPPESLNVISQTNVSVTLAWAKPSSMDVANVSYEVTYSFNQSGITLNQTTSLNVTLANLLSGSQYNISVVTIGVKDLRSLNTSLAVYTAPNAVQNLRVSAISTYSVSLSWIPPSGMSSLFYYSINNTPSDQNLNTTNNSYQITQLQPGSLYTCSVRTFIAAAYGTIFGPLQSIPCNTKPLPVTNLTASPVGTTEMRLSWSPQSNNKSLYQYNVSVNGEFKMQTSNETCLVSGLISGNNYTFTVQAVVNGLGSDPAVTSAFTGLAKASNISVIGSTQSMRVEWMPPPGSVTLYNVTIFLNGTVLKMVSQPNTTVVFTDLLPGTQYSVIVTSISGPVKQDSDSVLNATLPTSPGELSAVRSTNSLNISWAPPINMSSVSYYFLLQYSNSTSLINSVNCNQNYTSLTGLSAGVQYNITVKTVSAMGYMSSPQYLTAYTNPTAVTDVRVNAYNETSITLSWQQRDVQQSGYSYLLAFTRPDGTVDNKTVSSTTAQLLSLRSATLYNISIVTQTADGTKSDPQFTTAYSKPFPVSNVTYEVLNVSALKLSWLPPQEYRSEFSYQVLVSNCTEGRNLSTFSENVTVTGLQPGTLCQFIIYSLACGILGDPVNISILTKPSVVVPNVDNQGSNQSLLVMWVHPAGGLDMYILNISSNNGWSNSALLNSTENNYTFTQLKAASVFTVTLTTVKGNFRETSQPVNSTTYPNRPGGIKYLSKNNHSVWFQWDEAQNMTIGSFKYNLTYTSSNNKSGQIFTSNNSLLVDGLQSGTTYCVYVATVGPMGLQSDPSLHQVTTSPNPVRNLKVLSTTMNSISISWEAVERVSKYVVSVNGSMVENGTTSLNYAINNLSPSTHYSISVQSSTSDNTEGDAVWLPGCTDAAPVDWVNCMGPNLTSPMLQLSWSHHLGGNKGFKVKLSSLNSPVTTPSLNYNFTGLQYNTQYTATLWTLGCGNDSEETVISCKTGFTRPVKPNIAAVSVSEQQYNKFTVVLPSSIFDNSNGIVTHYGVLISTSSFDPGTNYSEYLQNTYNDWKAMKCRTFLAVVKSTESRTVEGQKVTIGDASANVINDYNNGELNAKQSYNFAIIAFTLLGIKQGLVDVSNSYYSVSEHSNLITLPENPAVIGGAAAGAAFVAVAIAVIFGVLFCKRKQRKDNSTSIPIHSIRNKVSAPIKVEDYEAYYKRQRADSFCGFAEEFEDLRPVGMNQAKAISQLPENKAKNRYNNVLPYDSSRVKLSVLGSSFDDYINASYMPGYASKKEFIAAQGPLPCTVNDFWRMIWEKNVHTIVMLTKCNEQGRVKCEEYWPADVKHFNNLKVTTTSEIPLEDWTLRDFEVKNVKTAEARSVRHFHFTAWPDHGVPETTELLINFRHLVREHMDQYSRHSPTLVHCSAGVGRTGTFIAIDRLIFQIERDGVVDVYGIIHDLRMHRPLMVQTEDQYVFLNQCAMDIIKSRTGNNVDLIYQNTAALTIYENFEPLKKAKNGYHKA